MALEWIFWTYEGAQLSLFNLREGTIVKNFPESHVNFLGLFQRLVAAIRFYPTSNLAMTLGSGSCLVGLGLTSHNNISSKESLEAFKKGKDLPRTIVIEEKIRQIRVRLVYLYRTNLRLPKRTRLAPNVELLGENYVIVLPPSAHFGGSEFDYPITNDPWSYQASIPFLPIWLIEELSKQSF